MINLNMYDNFGFEDREVPQECPCACSDPSPAACKACFDVAEAKVLGEKAALRFLERIRTREARLEACKRARAMSPQEKVDSEDFEACVCASLRSHDDVRDLLCRLTMECVAMHERERVLADKLCDAYLEIEHLTAQPENPGTPVFDENCPF